MEDKYIIIDWANNHLSNLGKFESFDEAWDFIYENFEEEYEGDGTYDEFFVMLESDYAPNKIYGLN